MNALHHIIKASLDETAVEFSNKGNPLGKRKDNGNIISLCKPVACLFGRNNIKGVLLDELASRYCVIAAMTYVTFYIHFLAH